MTPGREPVPGGPAPPWLRELAAAVETMEIHPQLVPPPTGAAFPGGTIDAGDGGPVGAALREAVEEVGLDPGGVDVVGTLPEVFIPRTGFRVIPVLAWWRRPSAVAPVDPGEVAAVERVSVAELADPGARLMVRVRDGRTTPAFRVRGMLIWGFTAALVDRLLALGGWEKPWDVSVVTDL